MRGSLLVADYAGTLTLEGQGRKNILICPVAFCADGDTMRALRDRTRGFEDRMTLQWTPGLGGGLE